MCPTGTATESALQTALVEAPADDGQTPRGREGAPGLGDTALGRIELIGNAACRFNCPSAPVTLHPRATNSDAHRSGLGHGEPVKGVCLVDPSSRCPLMGLPREPPQMLRSGS